MDVLKREFEGLDVTLLGKFTLLHVLTHTSTLLAKIKLHKES